MVNPHLVRWLILTIKDSMRIMKRKLILEFNFSRGLILHGVDSLYRPGIGYPQWFAHRRYVDDDARHAGGLTSKRYCHASIGRRRRATARKYGTINQAK